MLSIYSLCSIDSMSVFGGTKKSLMTDSIFLHMQDQKDHEILQKSSAFSKLKSAYLYNNIPNEA